MGVFSIDDDHDDQHVRAIDAEGHQFMFAEIGAGNRYDKDIGDFPER